MKNINQATSIPKTAAAAADPTGPLVTLVRFAYSGGPYVHPCGARPMIVIVAIVLGAILGDLRARRARGNGKDRLQYAAVHAIAFAIVALFVTVLIDRALRG